ncbi:MAG: zinc-binding dehydrogenase, partial [Myxococcales bacterium]|nr:zinc-binding dehydrogenase [Myxococcales bacterium]
AAFSLRSVTAWSNHRMAFGTLRLALDEKELPQPYVWGWGGGVTLAQLHLARLQGCQTVQISSDERRRKAAEDLGIDTIDRAEFKDLRWDEKKYKTDPDYKARYKAAEATFLAKVEEKTGGEGVHIFIDYVGSPVIRATQKALARQGVLTTAGWKAGMRVWFLRAVECIERHQHIHTHYARYSEGVQAVNFAEANGWLPTPDERIYDYDEVPQLAEDYDAGDFVYFPIYRVNE